MSTQLAHNLRAHYRTRHLKAVPVLLALITPILADRERLWPDETTTIMLIERWNSWEILTQLPVYQPHMPGWFLIPELAGYPVAMAVSFFSLAPTAWATIQIADHLDGPRAGVLAGLLVAASPYLAVEASWLRMYGVLTMLLTFALYWGLTERYWLATAATAGACLTHIFGAFAVPWLMYRADWGRRLSLRQSGVLAVSGLGPALVVANKVFLHHGGSWSTASTGVGHGLRPGVLRVVLTPAAALLGSPHNQMQVGLALFFTGVVFWNARQKHLLAWILIPLASIALASYLLHPVYRLKYFGMVAPAVAVFAVTIDRRWQQALVGATAGALVAWSWLQARAVLIIARRFQFWFI